MKFFKVISFLFFILMLIPPLSAELNSDVEVIYKSEYEVDEKDEEFVLEEKIYEKRQFHGDRTMESEAIITIGSDKVKAWINDEKLDEYYANSLLIHPKEDFKKGDVFEYEIEREYKKSYFFPIIYIQNDGFIKEWSIEIEHPGEFEVVLDFFFPRDSLPCTVTREKKKTTLIFRDIPYQKRLLFFPYNNIQAAILVSLKKDGDFFTPTTPDKFAEWYYEYASLDRDIDSSLFIEIDSLIPGTIDDTVKLRTLHDYIRRNIRYILREDSGSGIIPRDPDSFYVSKYGDCKDRALFVSKVADHANLDVEMGLVHTEYSPNFKGKVHPALFNHVICSYPLADSTCYFDPTSRYTRFGNPLNYIYGREIFILDTANPRYEVFPPSGRNPSLEMYITGQLESPVDTEARIIIRNNLENSVKAAENELTPHEFELFLKRLIRNRIDKIEIHEIAKSGEYHDRTEFRAVIDISNQLISVRNKYYITHLPFSIGDKDLAIRSDDNYPLTLGNSFGLRLELRLESPEYEAVYDSVMHFLSDDIYYTAVLAPEDSSVIRLSYIYNRIPEELVGDIRDRFVRYGLDLMQEKKEMFLIKGKVDETN